MDNDAKTLRINSGTILDSNNHGIAFDPDMARRALIDIFAEMGLLPTMDNFEAVAGQLSKLANVKKAWSAKYVHSVYHGYKGCQASAAFGHAIQALGQTIDDTPPGVAGAEWARILAYPGIITDVTLLPRNAEVVVCARPGCPVRFVKVHSTQLYHDSECQKIWKKERRKLNK